MGPECISDKCDFPMVPARDFCPLCGTDNREPSMRLRVPPHVHLYEGAMVFCVHCGAAKDRIFDIAPAPRIVLATLATTAGVLSYLAAGLIQIGHALPDSAFGKMVEGWYSAQVPARHSLITKETIERGIPGTFNLIIIGSLFTLLGIAMFVNRRGMNIGGKG